MVSTMARWRLTQDMFVNEGTIIAGAAATNIVTQKIIDALQEAMAGGKSKPIPDEDLEAADIDGIYEVSYNANA